jgi:hypothetical protein
MHHDMTIAVLNWGFTSVPALGKTLFKLNDRMYIRAGKNMAY